MNEAQSQALLDEQAEQLDYLRRILLAPIYDTVVETELTHLTKLSTRLNNQIYLKREDQQPVHSFKLRGACNKLAQLSEAECIHGVIAASAGNHAQGLALAASKLGIKATIVMPKTTPDIKVDAVRRFGGENVNVVLHGTSFDQASSHAKALCETHGYTFVPPFDDPDVIAGQGTVARELLEQNPNLDILFIAVGGGGLAAGIAVYLKQLKPSIKIVAVESEESACFIKAKAQGAPTELESVGIFADGVAVKVMGQETFRLCNRLIDETITVTNDEICGAIKDIFDDTRVIAEPAGALSVAAIRKYAKQHELKGKKLGGILCGANINFHTLRYVSERCELGELMQCSRVNGSTADKVGALPSLCPAYTSGGGIVARCAPQHRATHARHPSIPPLLASNVGGHCLVALCVSPHHGD